MKKILIILLLFLSCSPAIQQDRDARRYSSYSVHQLYTVSSKDVVIADFKVIETGMVKGTDFYKMVIICVVNSEVYDSKQIYIRKVGEWKKRIGRDINNMINDIIRNYKKEYKNERTYNFIK